MSACATLVQDASNGVAAALQAVDCMAGQATQNAFARLFGTQGALLPALTIFLSLYIGIFAIGLLTGRTRLGIAALTPRMLLLGVVLTFATSWVAYQSVLWNLVAGAPDQIAGVLMGTKGPASQLFAGRIDLLFQAIADAAELASQQQAGAGIAAPVNAAFAPGSLVWLAAVLLLLSTIGVLVTSRIVLAVLLALGPVFIVLSLFGGTRGLAAGWLRALVLVAVTPLIAVLGGGLTIELAVPVVQRLSGPEGIEARPAFALFLIAAVHCVLMLLALRTAGTMVSGWRVFGLAREPQTSREFTTSRLHERAIAAPPTLVQARTGGRNTLAPEVVTLAAPPGRTAMAPATIVTMYPGQPPRRAQGIGSKWRRPVTTGEFLR